MKKRKIFVNGVEFTLVNKVYDEYNECYLYFVKECDEPFCDLYEEIREWNTLEQKIEKQD